MPEPAQGEALVKVKAASINPGEAKIREGLMHAVWPATFPSGEGSDLAGIVTKVGPGVEGSRVGDEVIGFTDRRASHAEYVVVEAKNLTASRRMCRGGRRLVGHCGKHGLCVGACGIPEAGRHGGGLGRRGRCWIDRRAAGQAGGGESDRHRQSGQPRMAGRARHPADGRTATAWPTGCVRPRSTRSSNHGGGYVKLAIELGVPTEPDRHDIDFAAARSTG